MLSSRRIALGALVLALAACTGNARGGDDPKRPDVVEKGKLAPSLTVGNWKNSKELKLEGLAGKVVILDFWAVW